jgi:hypothetical protein
MPGNDFRYARDGLIPCLEGAGLTFRSGSFLVLTVTWEFGFRRLEANLFRARDEYFGI